MTGFSPSFLVFVRNIPISGDYYSKISENEQNFSQIADKSQRITDCQKLPELYVNVRKRLYKAYLRNAHQYNLRKRDLKFRIGDKVWKRNYTFIPLSLLRSIYLVL